MLTQIVIKKLEAIRFEIEFFVDHTIKDDKVKNYISEDLLEDGSPIYFMMENIRWRHTSARIARQ